MTLSSFADPYFVPKLAGVWTAEPLAARAPAARPTGAPSGRGRLRAASPTLVALLKSRQYFRV